MAKTEVTQPIKKLLVSEDSQPHNVCAYCRVSTDERDQRNSLVSQQKFFETYFNRHPNWNNVRIFADEGLSGTSLEKRDQFNEMLALARVGGIDLILTKEVSRFSRNVQDLLNIVEELRDRGIYIWFLSDDINTESNDYREKLSIAGQSAEQESLRTSRRVRWGQMQQMERGRVFGRKEMFGYNIVTDELDQQHFVIIPEEAEIVKKIFHWFSMGDGTYRIAKRLEQMGIKTKRYKNGWTNTVILRILRNEKYVGDLAQGKTWTPDPLKHKKKYNRGESASFYTRDHHPEAAIIDRDLWDKVQAILDEKAPSEEIKAKHANRYWTSGKIFCGCCGGRYVSMRKKQKTVPYKAWVCYNNNQRGLPHEIINDLGEKVNVGCVGKRVNDRILQLAMHDILTEFIIPHAKEIIDKLSEEYRSITKPKDNTKEIDATRKGITTKQKEMAELTALYVQGKIPDEAYGATINLYNDQILELRFQLAELQKTPDTISAEIRYKEFIAQIEGLLSLQEDEINEGLYERITKKIVVHPNKVLEIHLSFMPMPYYLRYETTGRGDTFTASFEIITAEEATQTTTENE